MRRIPKFVAALVAVLAVAGCGQRADTGSQQLTVLAAASLTEAFEEVAARFEQQHPGVSVRFDFQGSSTLAEQVVQGRQADVLASADPATMAEVVRTGATAGQSATFATNRLAIAVPPGNPAGIRSLADLGDPGAVVVVCAPQVPCGAATEEVERAAGVRIQPASEENDVKSVLRKVVAGEADAGLVYRTDVRAAGGSVEGIEFPESARAVNDYPIAALADAPNPELADRFADFVRGPAGREVLAAHGFGAP
ncbi:molybdate ABC transporter substrate-binding protein [Saccharopolyspora cebuensis]|uniref:Molybdate ABC transporter substrate-binding protein n=1 Tax=Saccharopolyspora cebuensis TaxID=418759 RepID=A0ABV4CK73_9PSEU